MMATCKCKACGEEWTCRGVDEPDVNAFTLTGEQQACPGCGSDDFDIVGAEYEEPYDC